MGTISPEASVARVTRWRWGAWEGGMPRRWRTPVCNCISCGEMVVSVNSDNRTGDDYQVVPQRDIKWLPPEEQALMELAD